MGSVHYDKILTAFISGDFAAPENSVWLVYTAAIIESVGPASNIAELWKYVAKVVQEEEKQLIIARRLREGLLKTSPLVGFPKGINCLAALRAAVNETSPSVASILEKDKSLRADHSAAELEKRGHAFFNTVYSKVADRVLENMALSSGGYLDQFAILRVYGELMAEERILNAKETGLLEFIVCYVSSAAPQANGHMYGSRNLGNGKEEIQKGIRLAQDMAEALNVIIDTANQSFIEKVDGW